MPLQLALDEYDRIDLPLDDATLEAWRLQFDRAAQTLNSQVLSDRLAARIVEGLWQCLDPDLRLPSGRQVQFATAVARGLNVALPGEALRYRASMDAFLDRYAEAFKARHIRRSQD
jgi:hypothetical protein